MGSVEKEARTRRRKGEIQQALLGAIALSGILLVSMAAPNTLQLLGKFGPTRRRFTDQTKTALSRLASRGLVTFVEKGGKRYARITEAGRRTLLREQMKFAGAVRRRWDKRWRVVMFDISEKRRTTRDSLRRTMREIGFVRLQDSAWIYPYDCEDVVALIKADLEIGKAVLYMVVEHIDNEADLKKEFGLK